MIMVIPKWLKEWHLKCVKVKYVVSCLGWLVSLSWCMYESEYEMSRLRMLNPLSLECMNEMLPWMMLRGSLYETFNLVVSLWMLKSKAVMLSFMLKIDRLKVNWVELHHNKP